MKNPYPSKHPFSIRGSSDFYPLKWDYHGIVLYKIPVSVLQDVKPITHSLSLSDLMYRSC